MAFAKEELAEMMGGIARVMTAAIFCSLSSCNSAEVDRHTVVGASYAIDSSVRAIPCSSIDALKEVKAAPPSVKKSGVISYRSRLHRPSNAIFFVRDGDLDYTNLTEESESFSPLSSFRLINNSSPLGKCVEVYADGPKSLEQVNIPREAEILKVTSPSISSVGDISQYTYLWGIVFVGAPVNEIVSARYPEGFSRLALIGHGLSIEAPGNFSTVVDHR